MRKHLKHLTILIVLALSLTPVIWFVGKGSNVLINGVDTNFPLNPTVWFLRRFYVWNPIANAGIDFSSSTAGLFFHFVQTFPYLLNLPLQKVEIFSMVFWFLCISLSSYYFASQIFQKSLPRLVFVIFYTLNIYLFNSWENVKVANLTLVTAIPFASAILYKLLKSEIGWSKSMLSLSVLGILLSGTGINPAYFISFFITLFIFWTGSLLEENDKLLSIKKVAFFTIVIIFVNAFWIIPSANFILKQINPSQSISSLGFTNWLDSLSHDTSIINILRLQGAWDWYASGATGVPLYIPYSVNYFHRLPFIAFSFLVVFLAMTSLIFKKRKYKSLYASFALMLILGVFLGAGSHPPTGGLYRFLTLKLPFFSLFRSPWYIFTPMLTFSYAGLLGLLTSKLLEKGRVIALLTTLIGVVILIGNLLYSYPLITGKIFRPAVSGSFYISFPKYIFDAGKYLDGSTGRVISYPNEEIQEFNWGYRGVESVISLSSKAETIFPSFNSDGKPISSLINNFYLALKKGEYDVTENLANKLRINKLVVNNDQNSISPKLNFSGLNASRKSIGEWDIYDYPDGGQKSKIYSASEIFFADPKNGASALNLLTANQHLLNPSDTQVVSSGLSMDSSGEVVVAKNNQEEMIDSFGSATNLSEKLVKRDLSKVVFTFSITQDDMYEPRLENHKLDYFGIAKDDVDVAIDGNKENWKGNIDGSYVVFPERFFKKGEHEIEIGLENKNLFQNQSVLDVNSFERVIHGEKGKSDFEVLGDPGNNYLSIENVNTDEVSAKFEINDFDSTFSYYVNIDYKNIFGERPTVYFLQGNGRDLIKSDREGLPTYPEFKNYSFFFKPVLATSNANVLLTIPYSSDPFGSKAFFKSLKVYRVFTNQLLLIKTAKSTYNAPNITILKNTPTSYDARVEDTNSPHILIFADNYSDDWSIKLYDKSGNTLNVKPQHFSIDLYSNGWYVPKGLGTYFVRIEYTPQKLFYLGVLISGVAVVISFFSFIKFDIIKKFLSRKKDEQIK